MVTVDNLRNNLIDKLLTISSKEYLIALNKLVEKKTFDTAAVKLSKAQILMLQLSDEDIKNGRLISQEQLDKEDREFLTLLSTNK